MQLIASNGYCPADTASQNVYVNGPLSVTTSAQASIHILWPNPSEESVQWGNAVVDHALIRVFNGIGEEVLSRQFNHEIIRWSVRDWAVGVYSVSISTENGHHLQKLLVHH